MATSAGEMGKTKQILKEIYAKSSECKKNTKTNSRNRDKNTYPLMDDVHVNCMHSISFYINLFLSSQLTMTLRKLWE